MIVPRGTGGSVLVEKHFRLRAKANQDTEAALCRFGGLPSDGKERRSNSKLPTVPARDGLKRMDHSGQDEGTIPLLRKTPERA